MDAAGPALLRKTTGLDVDGEIVWSWPPDAEVKWASMCQRIAPMKFLPRTPVIACVTIRRESSSLTP